MNELKEFLVVFCLSILIGMGIVHLDREFSKNKLRSDMDIKVFTENCRSITHPNEFFVEDIYGQLICVKIVQAQK